MKQAHVLIAAGTALAALLATSSLAFADNAKDCPNGGTVRFGVEPYDTAPKLGPIYEHIGKLIGAKLGCDVKVFVATNYNAEIEAMRNGKLEIGQFGPLGYVLAHQIAKAEAVATFAAADNKPNTYWASLVTWPGSGIKTAADLKGHSFAFSDPASTSGHLFPAYGMRKVGLDPDRDVRGIYAGSHTASFEALRNHKVDAGELNSERVGNAARILQGRGRRLPVEVGPDSDRSGRGARRPAGGFQEAAHRDPAEPRSVRARRGRSQDHRRARPALRAADRQRL
jgi:phosphonate transport system substrate-binding protein